MGRIGCSWLRGVGGDKGCHLDCKWTNRLFVVKQVVSGTNRLFVVGGGEGVARGVIYIALGQIGCSWSNRW